MFSQVSERALLIPSSSRDSRTLNTLEEPSINLFHVTTFGHETAEKYNKYIEENYSSLSDEQRISLLSIINNHMIPLSSKAYSVIVSVSGSDESYHDALQHIKSRVFLNHLLVPRVMFFGTTGLLAAIQFTGAGKILLSRGVDGAGAASLIAPIVAAIATITLNVISVGGVQLSKTSNNVTRVDIIKTTRLVAILLGTGFGGVFVSTKLILPHVVRNIATAEIAGDFLATYAASVIPDLLLAVNGIVAFQNDKSWLMPPVTAAIYRLSAVALAYVFDKDYESYGAGLGVAVAAWSSMLVSQLWFCQDKYNDVKLWGLCDISDLSARMKEFIKNGAKLGLGGLTEWGNLAAITFIVGSFTDQLSETQPSVASLVLVNSFFQGLARASMFAASENKHILDTAITGQLSTDFHRINLVQLGVLSESVALDDSITRENINVALLSQYQFYNPENFAALPEIFSLKEFLGSLNRPIGELVNLDTAYHEDKIYIYKSIIAAIILNCMIAGLIYAARRIIIDYFSPTQLPGNNTIGNSTMVDQFSSTKSDANGKDLAEKLLLVNTLGLIPDGVRIVSGSILRGWGNLLLPNIVSLVLMSVIGIPVGAAVGLISEESIIPIFIVRNIAISIAACVNCYQIWQQFQSEHREKYQEARNKLTE